MNVGEIYFIRKFEYADGGLPTDKLVIVLHLDDTKTVVVRALTTSNESSVPDDRKNHGCTNSAASCLSFFLFAKGRQVGTDLKGNRFSFNKDTYVFVGSNVDVSESAEFIQYQPDGMKLLAVLDVSELQRLIKCVSASNSKGRLKRFCVLDKEIKPVTNAYYLSHPLLWMYPCYHVIR